jgi:hypothetical protein
MIGEVRARGRLGVDLAVPAQELARVTLNGARVGGDLGSARVPRGAQFERVPFADTSGETGDGGGACVHG